jgi:hypothetical protein
MKSMKKRYFSIPLVLVILLLVACEQDPTLFDQPDGIYFGAKTDSVSYSFAKYPNRTVDTIKIPVMVLGDASGHDRQITIEKLTGADVNATEGVHYKLMTPYKMPAGKVATELPIVVYRHADLDNNIVVLRLQLKENENFASGISSKTSLKVQVSYLQKPSTWGESGGSYWAGSSVNLGTWTKTKYKVVLNALYDQASDTTVSEFPYLRIGAPAISFQYLQFVRNYIRTNYPGNYSTPLGIGPTLRDPDAANAVIQVGPANY